MITLGEGKARALAGRVLRRRAGKAGTGESGGETLALSGRAARTRDAAQPGGSPWCGTRAKRAQDLTDADVIRYDGQWREVLAVYRSTEEWEELHGPLSGPDARPGPEAETARAALDWASPMWVLIELLSTDKSTPAETDYDLIRLYRFDLAETQTLPAYETRPAAPNGA